MTALPAVDDLPYYLPRDTDGQLKALAGILEIPYPLVENTGETGLQAMTVTIMFRHLEKRERDAALRVIDQLENRQLIGLLRTKAIDTAYVNKRWGVWSMTNEELENDKSFHDLVVTVAGILGVSFSASSAKDVAKETIRQRRLTKGGVVTIVVWVAVISSVSSSWKLGDELERRSQQKTSPYF